MAVFAVRCGTMLMRSQLFVGICHCRDCQKFTGSAFGTLLGVPQSDLEIHGEPKSYSKLGDSGKPIVRLFCPECGSSIAEAPSTRPGMLILNAGTLDDPTSVTPHFEIYRPRSNMGAVGW